MRIRELLYGLFESEPQPPQVAPGRSPFQEPLAAAPGMTRLYRVEGGAPTKPTPDWLQQAVQTRNQTAGWGEAQGRWFSNTPKTLPWYLNDRGPGANLHYVDVPHEVAKTYQVSNLPDTLKYGNDRSVKAYSRDPHTEVFLPHDIASQKQAMPIPPEFRAGTPEPAVGTPSVSSQARPAAPPTMGAMGGTSMGRGGGGLTGNLDSVGNPMTKLGVGTRSPQEID